MVSLRLQGPIWMLAGVLSLICASLLFFTNPVLTVTKTFVNLRSSPMLQIWESPSSPIYTYLYIFNITNREKFIAGEEKLRVQEVGPYVYRENMVHSNVTQNENDTMSGVPSHQIEWRGDLSNGLQENDTFVVPNFIVLSLANLAKSKGFFTQRTLDIYLRTTGDEGIMTVTAKDLFFGIESALTKVGNKLFPNWLKQEKFGIVDQMYDFKGDYATFYNGEFNRSLGGLFATYNGAQKLPQWNAPCGYVNGSSDATKFQSFLTTDDTIYFYRKSICRTLPLRTNGTEEYRNGIRGLKFNVNKNIFDNGEFLEENKCFCFDGKCLPRGLIDLSPCYYGFPLVASFPHFKYIREDIRDSIDGFFPLNKHETQITVEPLTGVPLSVSVNLQVNIMPGDVSFSRRTSYFSNMVVPILYVDIRMDNLDSTTTLLLLTATKIGPWLQFIIMLCLYIFGVIAVVYALSRFKHSFRPPADKADHSLLKKNLNQIMHHTSIKIIK